MLSAGIKALLKEVEKAHPRYAGQERPPSRWVSSEYRRGYTHGYIDALREALQIREEEEDE